MPVRCIGARVARVKDFTRARIPDRPRWRQTRSLRRPISAASRWLPLSRGKWTRPCSHPSRSRSRKAQERH